MKCPYCGVIHDTEYQYCPDCRLMFRVKCKRYRERNKKIKPTKCAICKCDLIQSPKGRPKIYCNSCAYEKIKQAHMKRRQHGKNN